jgi:uncharacterized SAM-binding protein YcdF (DUF218 family)
VLELSMTEVTPPSTDRLAPFAGFSQEADERGMPSAMRLGVLLAVVLLVGFAWRERTAPLRRLAQALVREEPVGAADVGVVSMAQPRSAALDAAKLYHRGLVRQVWITPWLDEPADRRIDALGVRVPRHHEVARSILEKAGVPASAITLLDRPVAGLEGEMAVVGRALRARPGTRAVVVTQRSHTARAALLLRHAYAPGAEVMVRAAHVDRFDPDGWWRERGAVREVVLESLKWAVLLTRGVQAR